MAMSVPQESCSLSPVTHCSNVTRLLPKLELKKKCVDVPKEVCFSVRRPKKIRRPTVKIWCSDQVNEANEIPDEEDEKTANDDDDGGGDIKLRHTLMVFGGGGEGQTTTEVLDLSGKKNKCENAPTPLPVQAEGMALIRVRGSPMACGGYNVEGDYVQRECYLYDGGTQSWKLFEESMVSNRTHSRVVQIREDVWWLISGSSMDQPVTEVFSGGIFTVGPNPPRGADFAEACVTLIGHDHVIVTHSTTVQQSLHHIIRLFSGVFRGAATRWSFLLVQLEERRLDRVAECAGRFGERNGVRNGHCHERGGGGGGTHVGGRHGGGVGKGAALPLGDQVVAGSRRWVSSGGDGRRRGVVRVCGVLSRRHGHGGWI